MESLGPDRQCVLCGEVLPHGIKLALFSNPEADEAFLGDFCSVAHAFAALEKIAQMSSNAPETIFLGVRVVRDSHDEAALAAIMAEIARRAVRAAMAGDDAVEETVPRVSNSSLN